MAMITDVHRIKRLLEGATIADTFIYDFDDGRGGVAHDVTFVVRTSGRTGGQTLRLKFNVQETESDYGVEPLLCDFNEEASNA